MDHYKRYLLITTLYGLCFISGIVLSLFFIFEKKYFLAFLGIAFSYVAIDNFFCGTRAKTCGFQVTEHYISPWKIKK